MPKPNKLKCRECGMTAPVPIVLLVANPKHAADGRCSNRKACETRKRRNETSAKAQEKR